MFQGFVGISLDNWFIGSDTLPETHSSPLKINRFNGWKMKFHFGMTYFQGLR